MDVFFFSLSLLFVLLKLNCHHLKIPLQMYTSVKNFTLELNQIELRNFVFFFSCFNSILFDCVWRMTKDNVGVLHPAKQKLQNDQPCLVWKPLEIENQFNFRTIDSEIIFFESISTPTLNTAIQSNMHVI